MTVSNETSRTSATGSGSTGQEVAFSFPITLSSDLDVKKRVTATGVETDLTETTNYTVAISGNLGGRLTTVTTIETTEQIHIIRKTPKTQVLDLESGGTYNAENIEDALDKSRKINAENYDALTNKCLTFPETDGSDLTTELPNAIDRASKALTFDASGNATAASAVPTGSVTFTDFGTNMAEAANATAGLAVLELDDYTKTLKTADIQTKGPIFDVRSYGTTGDGATDDEAAINLATAAANTAGGGVVYIPATTSGYSVEAPILLYSDVTLLMDVATVITRNFSAVVADKWTTGTIQCTGTSEAVPATNVSVIGGQIVAGDNTMDGVHIVMNWVNGVRLERVKVLQTYSDFGIIIRGDNGFYNNLWINTISTEYDSAGNQDGLHIWTGNDIVISNCFIRSGDDSLAFVNSETVAQAQDLYGISDVTVTNCILESHRNNIKLGFSHPANTLDEYVQRITFTNVTGRQLGGGGNSHSSTNVKALVESDADGTSAGRVRDVTFQNCVFTHDGYAGTGTTNEGIGIEYCKNITFDNVHVITPDREGYQIVNCNEVTIKGGSVRSPRDANMQCIDVDTVDGLVIDGVYVYDPNHHAIRLNDVTNAQIVNCYIDEIQNGKAGIASKSGSTNTNILISNNIFSETSGANSDGYSGQLNDNYVVVSGNDFSGVDEPIANQELISNLKITSNIGQTSDWEQKIVCNQNRVVCNKNRVVVNGV